MTAVSVIVPIYKVERYLDSCIQSILSQTVRDIEVLLINDGSPDRCGDICEAYAKRDGRIRYFSTPNQGVGAARNLGMEQATGEWLCFVDGDDYLPADSLEHLLLAGQKADIVIGGYYVDEGGKIRPRTADRGGDARDKPQRYRLIGHALGCCNCIGAKDIYNLTTPWGKLYRRQFCADEGLTFPPIKKAQDLIFSVNAYQRTERVAFSDSRVYFCRHHAASISHRYIPDFADTAGLFLEYLREALKPETDPDFAEMYEYEKQRFLILNIKQTVAHPDCPLSRREKLREISRLCGIYDIKAGFPKIPRDMLSARQRLLLWVLYREYWGLALFLYEGKRRFGGMAAWQRFQ